MLHEVRQVDLIAIRLDGGTQARAEINEEKVAEYAEKIAGGERMPPVVVFEDGATLWLGDGFHRVHASRRAGLSLVAAEVRHGTKREAILFAAGANAEHGLPRTHADKRKAVSMLLSDPEWAQWSDREIARRCCVHHSFVSRGRESTSVAKRQIGAERKVERNGTIYVQQTENIGKRHDTVAPSRPEESITARPDHSALITKHREVPQSRGTGLAFAHKAIEFLQQIPLDDGLRDDAFDTVAQWIVDNR